MNIESHLANEAGTMLAKAKDDVIKAAITKKFGTDKWTLETIMPRLTREVHFNKDGKESFEIWKLDNEALVQIFPLELEESSGIGSKIVYKFNHKTFV